MMAAYEVRRDHAGEVELRCPGCGRWGTVDDDQAHGRVSIDHSGTVGFDGRVCAFHEHVDLGPSVEAYDERVTSNSP